MDNTSFKVAYSKWDEDDRDTANQAERSDWDDFDFYVAEVGQKFSDNFTGGLGLYWMDNNSNDSAGTGAAINTLDYTDDIYFAGVNADWKINDKFGINGFFMYEGGERDYSNRYSSLPANQQKDFDFQAMAASVKGTMKIESGDLNVRVIYFSEDDDDKDNGRWQGFKGQYAFVKENQMQFLTDPYVMNDGKERYAEADAAEAGFGLLAVVLSGNHKLPENLYLNWGAGYYTAIDDERDDPSGYTTRISTTIVKTKTLATNFAPAFGKKFFEKVDVSLNGSYAGYGDFYKSTATPKSC